MIKDHFLPKIVLLFCVFFTLFFLIFSDLKKISEDSKKLQTEPQDYYNKEYFQLPEDVKLQAAFTTPHTIVKTPILLYHYVEYVKDPKDTIRKSLDVTPAVFEDQLKTLKNSSYQTVFINDIASAIDNQKPLPEKSIALTFDDGYKDFYTDAYPLLQKYQAKATVYIIVEFLDKPNYMTKNQIKELAASNLIEIASHTLHHVNLKSANPQVGEKEIIDSKKSLENLIGKPVNSFAYPYGAFSQFSIDLVHKAGYLSSASVIPGISQSDSNRFFLYRIRPGNKMDKNFLSWLEGPHIPTTNPLPTKPPIKKTP